MEGYAVTQELNLVGSLGRVVEGYPVIQELFMLCRAVPRCPSNHWVRIAGL